jgi:hypothetical protein
VKNRNDQARYLNRQSYPNIPTSLYDDKAPHQTHCRCLLTSLSSSLFPFQSSIMAKRSISWVFCSASLIFIVFVLFASNPFISPRQAPLDLGTESLENYNAPKTNIWSDLSDDEFDDVLGYLYNVPNDLNLTRVGKATA